MPIFLNNLDNSLVKSIRVKSLATLAILGVSASLIGCNQKEPEVKVEGAMGYANGQAISKVDFEVNMRLKRIDQNNEEEVKEAAERYLKRIAVAEIMAKENMIPMDLYFEEIQDYSRQTLYKRYMDKFIEKNLSEEMVRAYYDNNPKEFIAKQVNASHILIRLPKHPTDKQIEIARVKAVEVKAILEAGEEFSKVAKERSEDSISRNKGGELGWISKSTVSQVFSEAAFALDAGQLSEPVRTKYGWHIIKSNEAVRDTVIPYKRSRHKIARKLENEMRAAEAKRLEDLAETKLTL